MAGNRQAGDGPEPSRCPRCGAAVACGVVASAKEGRDTVGREPGSKTGEVHCWCLDWPRLSASLRLGAGACLCPACLRAALIAAGVAIDGTAADPAATGAAS
ncbi:cysteine-rich CWC family protein [Pandoraea sp. NPDC087047]|uniref:cysteine-rich CWC family protein n=1 Tax=Pandoraea sp. NPDC087047 TaxID=3364390 RepID=UPI00381E0F8D